MKNENQEVCEHLEFQAYIAFKRLTEYDAGPVTGYTADLKANCSVCGQAVRFKATMGYSVNEPRMSADTHELRIPFEMEETATIAEAIEAIQSGSRTVETETRSQTRTRQQYVVFTGPEGSGKTTTALELVNGENWQALAFEDCIGEEAFSRVTRDTTHLVIEGVPDSDKGLLFIQIMNGCPRFTIERAGLSDFTWTPIRIVFTTQMPADKLRRYFHNTNIEIIEL